MTNAQSGQNQTSTSSHAQPTNTSPTTQAPLPPTPKKKTTWLLIFLVVLFLGTTGGFAFKYFKYYNKYYELKQQLDNQQLTPLPSPQLVASSPSPIVSPKLVDITQANYINTEFGFSLNTPDSWNNKSQVVTDENSVTFEYKAINEEPYKLFWINRISEVEMNKLEQDPMFRGTKLGIKNGYAFIAHKTLDVPYSQKINMDTYGQMAGDISQILSTFEFTD